MTEIITQNADSIVTTLTAAVATDGTFVVNYPAGRSSASYGATGHTIQALGAKYALTSGFTLNFGGSNITVTWKASTTLPVGTRVVLILDQPDLVAARGTTQAAIADITDSATGAQIATAVNGLIAACEAFGILKPNS